MLKKISLVFYLVLLFGCSKKETPIPQNHYICTVAAILHNPDNSQMVFEYGKNNEYTRSYSVSGKGVYKKYEEEMSVSTGDSVWVNVLETVMKDVTKESQTVNISYTDVDNNFHIITQSFGTFSDTTRKYMIIK